MPRDPRQIANAIVSIDRGGAGGIDDGHEAAGIVVHVADVG